MGTFPYGLDGAGWTGIGVWSDCALAATEPADASPATTLSTNNPRTVLFNASPDLDSANRGHGIASCKFGCLAREADVGDDVRDRSLNGHDLLDDQRAGRRIQSVRQVLRRMVAAHRCVLADRAIAAWVMRLERLHVDDVILGERA